MPNSQTIEKQRLPALPALDLLASPSLECFDRVTRLCTQLFDCSMALISLVDTDRQWFLARSGLDLCETPHDILFCDHVFAARYSLKIDDTLEDDRFCQNPLVLGPPHIRAYLGQPIAAHDGSLIGTLCLADERPCRFGTSDVVRLAGLAGVVEDLIEAHRCRIEAIGFSAHLRACSDRLERANRIISQAEKVARIGSWELDIGLGKLTFSNASFAMLERPAVASLSIDSALEICAPADRPKVTKAIIEVLSSKGSTRFEATVLTPSGNTKRIKAMAEYLVPSADQAVRLVGIMQDVSEDHAARVALQRAADYDQLTGLLNRHAFDRALGDRLRQNRQSGEGFFVLLLELDRFKDVNDRFGHLVGDGALEEIGARLVGAVPEGSVVARWGGDEFAVMTPGDMSSAGALAMSDALIQAVGQDIEIAGRTISVGATGGLARSDEAVGARELLRRVDAALCYGKSREPGRTHRYAGHFEHETRLRRDAISTVRTALADGRVFAGYQPIVRLADSGLVGFEALMRLTTRSGEQMTAGQVLPAIQDPVVSRQISQRMIDLVCADFPTVLANQPDSCFVSLNATEADLVSQDFAGRLLATLHASRIAPSSITVEITETMLLVNDKVSVQAVLCKLSQAGVKIALDDFGTGFSSLSHLRDFPIDKVKIDGSFVQRMCAEHQTRLIVQALIAMARNLDKSVIAEGVETQEQRKLLVEMGCTLGQGFLFSPAETACRLALLPFAQKKGGAPSATVHHLRPSP